MGRCWALVVMLAGSRPEPRNAETFYHLGLSSGDKYGISAVGTSDANLIEIIGAR
jgi:hypothetical protein